ncbi:MAG: hypothetical protein H0S85_08245 [Desulfovibrionaceae bacterium]|jgi:hypothetical protein|nr:hypothetical protein [Desulfovibrionaceae bacterium]
MFGHKDSPAITRALNGDSRLVATYQPCRFGHNFTLYVGRSIASSIMDIGGVEGAEPPISLHLTDERLVDLRDMIDVALKYKKEEEARWDAEAKQSS